MARLARTGLEMLLCCPVANASIDASTRVRCVMEWRCARRRGWLTGTVAQSLTVPCMPALLPHAHACNCSQLLSHCLSHPPRNSQRLSVEFTLNRAEPAHEQEWTACYCCMLAAATCCSARHTHRDSASSATLMQVRHALCKCYERPQQVAFSLVAHFCALNLLLLLLAISAGPRDPLAESMLLANFLCALYTNVENLVDER